MKDYQWEVLYDKQKPDKDINKWQCSFGPKVVERFPNEKAKVVRFDLLLCNKNVDVFLVGDFNDWGEKNLDKYKFTLDSRNTFASITVDFIRHKDKYKFLVVDNNKRRFMEDPAGLFFDDLGNTVFWDFGDPLAYELKYDFVDNFHRSIKILQSDLPGLIVHFADKNGICGRDIKENKSFKFIAESGVIDEISKLGFNTVQFLPFSQSIDGSNWKFRYLVPFSFAIQKNWGNPDDFARMIDEFHKHKIAVIGDFVLGHLPYKDFKIFGQSSDDHGIHLWKKEDSSDLYLKDKTCWGTKRIDFDNSYVRDFFVSSCLSFMKHYRIDGFRVDNVDGIIRLGDNGDGEERANGRTFLKELNSAIYSFNPKALIDFESHYYYKDNAKMLVSPIGSEKRALGATAYNSSRLTYFFHTDFMLKTVNEISPWKIKHISEEKEWGKSNSTVSDFHNHDAAAGLMEGRATGAYAYNCMMEGNPANHFHALGKIKVMEAIISFCTEGRTLDLLQTFLLQPGTFEHDSSIQWFLTYNELNKNLVNYKRKVNEIMNDPAFWPLFVKNRVFLNVDDKSKVLVVERSAEYDGKKSRFVVIINLSASKHYNYAVGVKTKKDYKVVFNSDRFLYAGFGIVSYPEVLKNRESHNFEVLDREVELGVLAPYGIVVLKEI